MNDERMIRIIYYFFFSMLMCLWTQAHPACPADHSIRFSSFEIQKEQRELKEYKQRLNQFVSTLNRRKIDKVKTLYEAIKADIRREVSQIRAREIQQRKGTLNERESSLNPVQLEALITRSRRMSFIKKSIGQIAIQDNFSEKANSSDLLALLEEFEELMREEIASMKGE